MEIPRMSDSDFVQNEECLHWGPFCVQTLQDQVAKPLGLRWKTPALLQALV